MGRRPRLAGRTVAPSRIRAPEIVEGWGGVPWAWVFDNMKTVTLGRDAEGQPRWNPAFWRFATEVGFHPELCDPGAAQQKGSVENLVKWVKTNFLPGRSLHRR